MSAYLFSELTITMLFGKDRRKGPDRGPTAPANNEICDHGGRRQENTLGQPEIGLRWARDPGVFALRVDVADVAGYFRKGLVVEAGTRAILLLDGRNELGEVGHGRYTAADLLGRFADLGRASCAIAILADAGDLPLEFAVEELFTSDPVSIALDCRLVVRLDNAVLFLKNFMKERRAVDLSQLAEYLAPEIRDAAAEAVANRSIAALAANLALKEELATHVEAHLARTFKDLGLAFQRLSTLNFRHERWDEVRQVRERYFLQISREEAELAGRRRLADVLDEKEIQALAEQTREAARFELRAELWARLRRAIVANRMDELRTADEFARFVRGLDQQRLVEEDELERIKQQFAQRKEDRELARAHWLDKCELERDYERRMLALVREGELSREQIVIRQGLERQRLEGELAIRERLLVLDIKIRDLEREQGDRDLEQELKRIKVRAEQKRQDLAIELESLERRVELTVQLLQFLSGVSPEAFKSLSPRDLGRLASILGAIDSGQGDGAARPAASSVGSGGPGDGVSPPGSASAPERSSPSDAASGSAGRPWPTGPELYVVPLRASYLAQDPPPDFAVPDGYRYLGRVDDGPADHLFRERDGHLALRFPALPGVSDAFLVDKHAITAQQLGQCLNDLIRRGIAHVAFSKQGVASCADAAGRVLASDALHLWQQFSSGYRPSSPWGVTYQGDLWHPLPGCELLPAVLVSWWGARVYGFWAHGREDDLATAGAPYLPSVEQWRLAALFDPTARRWHLSYPWGDTWDRERVNYAGLWAGREVAGQAEWQRWWAARADVYRPTRPLPVSDLPHGHSPIGCVQLLGNVWEWCADAAPGKPARRAARGGSCLSPRDLCSPAYAAEWESDRANEYIGFRCVFNI